MFLARNEFLESANLNAAPATAGFLPWFRLRLRGHFSRRVYSQTRVLDRLEASSRPLSDLAFHRKAQARSAGRTGLAAISDGSPSGLVRLIFSPRAASHGRWACAVRGPLVCACGAREIASGILSLSADQKIATLEPRGRRRPQSRDAHASLASVQSQARKCGAGDGRSIGCYSARDLPCQFTQHATASDRHTSSISSTERLPQWGRKRAPRGPQRQGAAPPISHP